MTLKVALTSKYVSSMKTYKKKKKERKRITLSSAFRGAASRVLGVHGGACAPPDFRTLSLAIKPQNLLFRGV